MTRDDLQRTAALRLDTTRRLMCQWCTGCGKSGVVLRFLEANPGTETLILVPEQNNIQNWKDEFVKFNVPYDRVTIICYASLHKYINTSWDLLVFDEAPHVDTDKRKAICRTIKGKYVLALGAVIDDDEVDALESVYGHFEKSYVSLRRAIEWNILPSPEVRIIHISLDNEALSYKYNGRSLTALGMYSVIQDKVTKTVNAYNACSNSWTKTQMLRAGNERKRFIGEQKEGAMRLIASKLREKGRRFLCFCSSIKQAESLGGELAFTSKTPASMKLLERFNNHEIDSLYVVGKLIEGQNLKDIDCGIIGQLGGTKRITVQECGRIMRAENPVIYTPVFDNTKDDGFLYTLTSSIPEEYIKHYKL